MGSLIFWERSSGTTFNVIVPDIGSTLKKIIHFRVSHPIGKLFMTEFFIRDIPLVFHLSGKLHNGISNTWDSFFLLFFLLLIVAVIHLCNNIGRRKRQRKLISVFVTACVKGSTGNRHWGIFGRSRQLFLDLNCMGSLHQCTADDAVLITRGVV